MNDNNNADERRIRILYPEHRLVTPEQILSWANDLYVDDPEGDPPATLQDAMALLEDEGVVTFAKDQHRRH